MIKEVLKTKKYKAGYEIRDEIWAFDENDTHKINIKAAYTLNGDYIGDTKTAYRLCKTKNIKPQKRNADSNICSIGFCEERQTWAGWSHRAYYEFGIDSKVSKGDCGYVEDNYDDMVTSLSSIFLNNSSYRNVSFEETPEKNAVIVKFEDQMYEVSPYQDEDEDILCYVPTSWKDGMELYPYGHGEWEAKNLEDAKQMAIDFAEGVS